MKKRRQRVSSPTRLFAIVVTTRRTLVLFPNRQQAKTKLTSLTDSFEILGVKHCLHGYTLFSTRLQRTNSKRQNRISTLGVHPLFHVDNGVNVDKIK